MDNVGLVKGALELMDYRDDYPMIYEKEKEELLKIYENRIKQIEHVGSTSIKGIKSKPIIDIQVLTDDLETFKIYTESEVEGDVYTVRKEADTGGGYLVRKEEDGKVKAFIHVFQTGDNRFYRSILFRDYLNSHKNEIKRYEELKLELYNKYKNDRSAYTHAKDDYVEFIINKALKEE